MRNILPCVVIKPQLSLLYPAGKVRVFKASKLQRIEHVQYIIILAVCLFAGLVANTRNVIAEDYENGNVSVNYLPMFTPSSGNPGTVHGYVEHRFRVQNKSASDTKKVEISIKQNASSNQGIVSATGYVEVPAGQSAVLSILQPAVSMGYSLEATVRINRTTQRNTLKMSLSSYHCDPYSIGMHLATTSTFSSGGVHYSVEPSNAQVLVSGATPTPLRDLISQGDRTGFSSSGSDSGNTQEMAIIGDSADMVSGGMGGGMMGGGKRGPTIFELNLWRADADPDQWSDNWLALTRFDAIVMTDAEISSMPLPAFTALKRFVECGGILCVIGNSWQTPKEWTELSSIEGQGKIFYALFGTVYVLDHSAESLKNSADDVKSIIELLRNQTVGSSGSWVTAMQPGNMMHNMHMGRGMYGGGSSTGGFFSDSRRMVEALPATKSVAVPVRLIAVLIIVFAVVIGPVNLFVLSMKNRRIWLLWTVPVISIITSGLVLGTTIMQEGFVKTESSTSVTVLDQRSGEAITYGTVGFYSTLTPSNGLSFSSGTDAIYIGDKVSQKFSIVTQPGGEQQLTSGWISPRVPSYFGFRKAESRKERLEFNWSEQKPTVSNHLGVNIDTLTVCSPDGTLYTVKSIAAGDRKELEETKIGATKNTVQFDELLMVPFSRFDTWASASTSFDSGVIRNLIPGSYIAKFAKEPSPFVDRSLPKAKPYLNETTVLGFFE
ncbi:MAG: hypothetical protein ACRC2T_07325 [Thermoguttaceae bacterium]